MQITGLNFVFKSSGCGWRRWPPNTILSKQ